MYVWCKNSVKLTLSAPYDVKSGRFPKRLAVANHATHGGMSWDL